MLGCLESTMPRLSLLLAPLFVVAVGTALGCGDAAPTGPGPSVDGGAATLPCLAECLAHQPPAKGDIPCDVWQVLHKLPAESGGCHGCHSDPPQHGAPFPLTTYEALQAPYGTTVLRRYQEMCVQIQPSGSAFTQGGVVYQSIPHMPLPGAPQLSAEDFKTLNDWFNACAPPAPEGSLSAPPYDGGAVCCVPRTCAELGATCGAAVWNGCEGTVTCDNGVKDATETDVDCGGDAKPCRTRCGPGQACNANTDCDPVQGLACGADKKCH
jgi:hypothetical protein